MPVQFIRRARTAPDHDEPVWMFRQVGALKPQPWDWDDRGAPEPTALVPVRATRSGDLSAHIPVRAYCYTTASHVELESGLEHDLVRRLDRARDVDHLLGQPLTLEWPDGRRHTPDVLSRTTTGQVTVWDCRPAHRVDEDFEALAERTGRACAAVDWHYEVFTGLSLVERLNLLWLHSSRRRPSWAEHQMPTLRSALADGPAPLGEVLDADSGDGCLVALVWHLVWSGDLVMDLSEQITEDSLVAWGLSHG